MLFSRFGEALNLFGRGRRNNGKHCPGVRAHRRTLAIEPLEQRQLLSVFTWDGGSMEDSCWKTAENWDGNVAPDPGESLCFSGALRTDTVNDFPAGTEFDSIIFADDDFSLSGNAISLTGDITVNSAVSGSEVSLDGIELLGSATVSVYDGRSLTIDSDLSGDGSLTKSGGGELILGGANTYTGGTAINAGAVQLESDCALSAATSGVLIDGGAELDLNGYSISVGAVALMHGSIVNSGTAASLTASSYVVLDGEIGVQMYGGNAALMKTTDGAVTISGHTDYTGLTTVYAGELRFIAPDAWYSILFGAGVDIQNGRLVFSYSGYSGPPEEHPVLLVRGFLTAAHDIGFTSGKFYSSTATSDVVLGWRNNTGDQTVTIAYAVYGDANFDGTVDLIDLGIVGDHYNQTGKVWAEGDFNYDGDVDLLDLEAVGDHWNGTVPGQAPQVVQIARLGADATSADTVQFVVAFSQGVEGVDVWDFSLGGSGTTGTIDSVVDTSSSHAVYVVTVEDVYGNGELRLDLDDDNSIHTGDLTLVGDEGPIGSFTGDTYTVSSPFVWVGGTNKYWATDTNWVGDVAPLEGSSLVFQGTPPVGGTLALTTALADPNTYDGLTTLNAGILVLGLGAQSPVLSESGGGADLQGFDGQLVLDYYGGDDPADAVRDGLGSGKIFSSTASEAVGLGWIDETAPSRLTIVRALLGDANLDGTVDLLDLGCVGDNWNHVLADGYFVLDANSTYFVELTDDVPTVPVVTGPVVLGGATLDLTSNRSNNEYGILRVLIDNDGTDAVIGTFADLDEGDPVAADGVPYYNTYTYDAKPGEFGKGNDVAVYSSYFAVSSAWTDQVVNFVDQGPELDAEKYLNTYYDQYQLSICLSPRWNNDNPEFTYVSDTPSIATVDGSGLVTYLEDTEEARFHVVVSEAGYPDRTFEFRLGGMVSAPITEYVPNDIIGVAGEDYNVDDYVLVLYNKDSDDSTDLATYYRYHRPGMEMEDANYLGLEAGEEDDEGSIAWIYHRDNPELHLDTLPDTVGTSCADENICEAIVEYVTTWVEGCGLPIRYIVGMCGLPSRVDGDYNVGDSVSYMIYTELLAGTGKDGYIGGNGTSPFSVAQYGAPLIAWLDCGSYAATEAYINKEILVGAAGGLQGDGVTLSGSAAGVGATQWILDDQFVGGNAGYFASYQASLEAVGVSHDDITYNEGAPYPYALIITVSNPTAYGCWGQHSGPGDMDGTWPTTGPVTVYPDNTCHIGETYYYVGWWIGMSVESYNGVYGQPDQGDPTEFFAYNAFHGTDAAATIDTVEYTYYTSTPICWVGSTDEPKVAGCVGKPYFERWARDWSTIEAAWAGLRLRPDTGSCYPLVVTDVLLTP